VRARARSEALWWADGGTVSSVARVSERGRRGRGLGRASDGCHAEDLA
jgi:hypothetical protein